MTVKPQTIKRYSLEQVTTHYIGKRGTPARENFEQELNINLLGDAIRSARTARALTQEQLGKLVGVRKAQISKLENSLTDARLETVLKVFKALNARISFQVSLLKAPAERFQVAEPIKKLKGNKLHRKSRKKVG